jgi:hypothetical protein
VQVGCITISAQGKAKTRVATHDFERECVDHLTQQELIKRAGENNNSATKVGIHEQHERINE